MTCGALARKRAIRAILALLFIVTGGFSATGGAARAAGQTDMGIREYRLPDGLTVLMKETHAAPVVCTYVWYRVGSRDEKPGITGISHQLEHMMFKGTRKQFPNPGYIDLLVGRYGGENNAETDTDTTSYYLLLPSDQLDLALRIEADRMTDAAIDAKALASENTVVLSELEGDENSNPYFLYENTRAAAFQYHPYHYPVIGTKWDVSHFTRDAVYTYYRRHYAPNNAVLVLVGDFDTEKTLERIKELWRDVRPEPLPSGVVDPEPEQRGERRILTRRAGANSFLEMMFHIPPAVHPDLPALTVLATLLTEGRSTRLYRALVESQLATDVSASANLGLDPEVLDISASARVGVDPAAIEKALIAELDRVQKEPVTERELQKAKNQTRADFIFAQDSVEAQASRIGFFQLVAGGWRNLSNYLNRIDAVTAADVQRVARAYLTSDNRTVGTFVPNGQPVTPDMGLGPRAVHYKPTGEAQARRDDLRPTDAIAGQPSSAGASNVPRSSSSGATQELKLPNGMTVIVRENHANPTVSISGFVRAGSVDDPVGKFGLAAMTAAMLTRGTSSRTSQQIADQMDFVGARMGFGAGRERTNIDGVMLAGNFHEMLGLLADMIRNPSLPSEEMEKVRGETLTLLQEEEDDTGEVATHRLYSQLYPDNPLYGHSPEGSPDGVKSVVRDDIATFYRRAYRPERTTLVVVGDVGARDAFADVEKVFGDWKGVGEALPAYVPRPPSGTSSVSQPVMVVMPDKAQDDIVLGEIGLSRLVPDYQAAALMNLILGGDPFVGRVGKRVRDTEGLAYYAYTAFVPGLATGPFVFRAGANPKNVWHAVTSARAEIKRMEETGVTQAELEWAKDHAIGSLRLSLATNAGYAEMLENSAFFHLGLDYADRYAGIIRAVSRSQVDSAARRYLRPDVLVMVVAGPPVVSSAVTSGTTKTSQP